MAVEMLINEHHLDPCQPDLFGRKPLWIAKKKRHSEVLKLLQIYEEELDKNPILTPIEKDDQLGLECDVCTSNIPRTALHYHCTICAAGDWDICEDCREWGVRCLGPGHILVQRKMVDGVWSETTS